MGKMYVNIIHRPLDRGAKFIEGFTFQQDAAHKLGLKTTQLIPYSSMFNDNLISLVKNYAEKYGDEIGIWLGDYEGAQFSEKFNTRECMFWLLPDDLKKKIGAEIINRFRTVFGFSPVSIGHYYLDAHSISYLKKMCPSLRITVATCFEEGVNMFHGTKYCWHILNDGGPWSAWIPSRKNTLLPAENKADDNGVVAVPHLSRDMVLSFLGRNDFFASHPPNILRGKVYKDDSSVYHLNFIDQWINQARTVNGYAYYNVHVSLPWVVESNMFEEDISVSRKLYTDSLAHLAQRKSEGHVQDMTMSEYAVWHRKNRKYASTDFCQWKEMLQNTGHEYLWAVNPHYRATIGLNNGTAIIDFRPFEGRIANNTGGDEKGGLWATYPYICKSSLRMGMGARLGRPSIFSTIIEGNGASVNLDNTRVYGSLKECKDGNELICEDLTLDLKGMKVLVALKVRFAIKGAIIYSATLKQCSRKDAVVKITHYMSGAPGVTEYPDEGRGITLTAEALNKKISLVTKYRSVHKTLAGAKCVSAKVPKLNTVFIMKPKAKALEAFIDDEHLFSPFFNIGLTQEIKTGGTAETCLILQRIK